MLFFGVPTSKNSQMLVVYSNIYIYKYYHYLNVLIFYINMFLISSKKQFMHSQISRFFLFNLLGSLLDSEPHLSTGVIFCADQIKISKNPNYPCKGHL